MRLIDADTLKADLKQYFTDGVLDGVSAKVLFNQILHDIDNAPTVHDTINLYPSGEVIVQETRPHGKWITEHGNIECNLCGCWFYLTELNDGKANFCPNCGADMRQEESE